MTNQELQRLHAIVEGRVQGVGFRYFTQERAVFLGSDWLGAQPLGWHRRTGRRRPHGGPRDPAENAPARPANWHYPKCES